MGDAGHQAAERDHLLGACSRLALVRLVRVLRRSRALIRPPQFAHRAAGDHHPYQLAGLRNARGAVHRYRNRRPVAGAQKELLIVHPVPAEARAKPPRALVCSAAASAKRPVERLPCQFGRGPAGEVAERGIDFDDEPVAVAHDEDVRHRAEHA